MCYSSFVLQKHVEDIKHLKCKTFKERIIFTKQLKSARLQNLLNSILTAFCKNGDLNLLLHLISIFQASFQINWKKSLLKKAVLLSFKPNQVNCSLHFNQDKLSLCSSGFYITSIQRIFWQAWERKKSLNVLFISFLHLS